MLEKKMDLGGLLTLWCIWGNKEALQEQNTNMETIVCHNT